MQWLVLFTVLEFAWLPRAAMPMYDISPGSLVKIVDAAGSFSTSMQVECIMFDILFVRGKAQTGMMLIDKKYSFYPNKVEFDFGLGIRFGLIEIGFRHVCAHPVIPLLPLVNPQMKFEYGYEELYFRIESSIHN